MAVLPYHSILDINLSNTNVWYKDTQSVSVSIVLGIPEGKTVSHQIDLTPAGGTLQNLVAMGDPTAETLRQYSFSPTLLALGNNTITITTQDGTPPDGGDGKYVMTYTISVENRDSFTIQRKFKFDSEYVSSGALEMDRDVGVELTTGAGIEAGILLPVRSINMDGRASIHRIVVDADADNIGSAKNTYAPVYRQDRGDTTVLRFKLDDLKNFKAIQTVQAHDNA